MKNQNEEPIFKKWKLHNDQSTNFSINNEQIFQEEQTQDENNIQNIDVKDLTKLSSRKLNRLKSTSSIQKSKTKRKTDYLTNRNTNKKSNKHDSVLSK